MDALETAIEIVGGVGRLADLLEVVQGAVSNWKARGRVPAEYCPSIERITCGRVKCEQLRPDVEWVVLRAASAHEKSAACLSRAQAA